MMIMTAYVVFILMLWFLSTATFFNSGFCSGIAEPEVVCIESEKQALLSFKQGLNDPSKRLSSWSAQQNCCQWVGVKCHNVTGRVIELNLRNPIQDTESHSWRLFVLGGVINPALLELEYLSYLDLSFNNFGGIPIPSFLGSMKSLTYLNLFNSAFEGLIPHQLGNLSSIRYLDLAANSGLRIHNLNWVGGLYSLEYLDLSEINLKKGSSYWLQVIMQLPNLSELHLGSCGLRNFSNSTVPPLGYVNFTSLQVLDLSCNDFKSKIPDWLFNLTTNLVSLELSSSSVSGHIPDTISNLVMLEHLNLTYNQLTGWIPEGFGQLKNLQYLGFQKNKLHGPIPVSLGNLSSLKIIDLSRNHFNGTLPESIGLLSNLEELQLRANSLAGNLSEVNFAKLSNLKELDISLNFLLAFRVNPNWVPPFQLKNFRASSCKMGPDFPVWLRTQTFLKTLDISQSGISDTAPNWFWKLASGIERIYLYDNQIRGNTSNVWLNSSVIHLSSNRFQGQLPILSRNVAVLNFANNSFSGLISSFLCKQMHINNNVLILDLSNNLLSGELSDCWMHWQNLSNLHLGSNKLSGKIPNSMGFLVRLRTLHLNNNTLFGNIPLSLRNCTSLWLINLGENEFTGLVPNWIGEMTALEDLKLRSNKLNGNIPAQICQLSHLEVLDLANNSLSGTIPTCLNNLGAMARTDTSGLNLDTKIFHPFRENMWLFIKGRESEYKDNLKLVRSIDLSSNNLSGSIPDELSSLAGMQFLNLSHNQLSGNVPYDIGGIKMLESLDLSRNHLSGEIPPSISYLTFLSYLDLSYNFLSGRIPLGTQIQGFDEARFIGNADLCGAPLSKNCTKMDLGEAPTPVAKGDDEPEMVWFYSGLVPGFAVGFCGVCCVLFFKRNWRIAYFQFFDDVKDWIYVATLLKLKWLCRRFKRRDN